MKEEDVSHLYRPKVSVVDEFAKIDKDTLNDIVSGVDLANYDLVVNPYYEVRTVRDEYGFPASVSVRTYKDRSVNWEEERNIYKNYKIDKIIKDVEAMSDKCDDIINKLQEMTT